MLVLSIAKLIILVDQKSIYRSLNKCIDISTNTNITIISFIPNIMKDHKSVKTYVVTDLKSAVEAVWNYYK